MASDALIIGFIARARRMIPSMVASEDTKYCQVISVFMTTVQKTASCESRFPGASWSLDLLDLAQERD